MINTTGNTENIVCEYYKSKKNKINNWLIVQLIGFILNLGILSTSLLNLTWKTIPRNQILFKSECKPKKVTIVTIIKTKYFN